MTPVKIPVRSWVSQNLRQDFKMLLIVKSFQKTFRLFRDGGFKEEGAFSLFPHFLRGRHLVLFWYKLHMKYRKEKKTILHRLFPEITIKFLGDGWPQTPPPPLPDKLVPPAFVFRPPELKISFAVPAVMYILPFHKADFPPTGVQVWLNFLNNLTKLFTLLTASFSCRCKENCAHKLAPSKELVLDGVGCQDDTNTTCIWELYGPPPATGRISKRSVGEQLISISYAKQFQLDPRNLIPNRIYTILFNNDNSGFSAQYSVITDMFPTNGSCFVSPSEGQVIETQFIISCAGWRDEDSPLRYEFFLGNPEQGPMLLYYGWMPYSNGLFLPPGSKDNKHNVDLFVKISDVLGSYRIVPLQVKVCSYVDHIEMAFKKTLCYFESRVENRLTFRFSTGDRFWCRG